jgi:hypothetical protein
MIVFKVRHTILREAGKGIWQGWAFGARWPTRRGYMVVSGTVGKFHSGHEPGIYYFDNDLYSWRII